MDINVMIFLQALQFSIAYFFLYRFIFIPSYIILDEQKKAKDKLHYTLEQEQSTKDSLQKTYIERKVFLKESLMRMAPVNEQLHQLKKIDAGSTLYHVDTIKLPEKIIEQTEIFLIENLSQVRK